MIEDQPPPTSTSESRAVWPLVIEDLEDIIAPLEIMPSTHAVSPGPGAYQEMSATAFVEHHNRTLELLRADMRERDRVGTERYGTPLKTYNGRRHLVDAYQEMLDACVYLRAEIDENGDPDRLISLTQLYAGQVGAAMRLRALILLDEAKQR